MKYKVKVYYEVGAEMEIEATDVDSAERLACKELENNGVSDELKLRYVDYGVTKIYSVSTGE